MSSFIIEADCRLLQIRFGTFLQVQLKTLRIRCWKKISAWCGMVVACTQEDKYLGKNMLKHTYFDGNTENPNCLRGSHTLATCELSIPCCQMLSMPRTYLPGIVSMCQTKVSPNTQSQGNTASFSLKAQRVASSEWTWHAHTHTHRWSHIQRPTACCYTMIWFELIWVVCAQTCQNKHNIQTVKKKWWHQTAETLGFELYVVLTAGTCTIANLIPTVSLLWFLLFCSIMVIMLVSWCFLPREGFSSIQLRGTHALEMEKLLGGLKRMSQVCWSSQTNTEPLS